MSRTFFVFLVTLIVTGLSFGQNIKLKGSGGTIGGTVNVKGDINNNGATGTYTFSGTVNLNGTASTQNIGFSGETDALSFATLNAVGTTVKDVQVPTTVSTAFDINSGTAFNVNANTLNFGGTTSVTGGSFDASNASSVVNYTSGSAQTVLASTYGGTLGLSGAGAKSLGGIVTAAIVNHTASSGALTVDNDLTINGSSASSLDGISVSGTKTLKLTGATTLTIASVSANAGTIEVDNVGGQITFSQASFTNAGAVTGTNGALQFDGDLALSGGGSSLTLANASTATFSGNVTNSGGIATFGGTSTATYNDATGGADQAVLAASYYNLTLTGAADTTYGNGGAKVAGGNITIGAGGALTIAANNVFDMASNSLTLNGSGANSGKIKWAAGNTFVAGSGVTEFYGSSAATVAANTGYGILLFTGGGAKTISGTVTAGPGSGSGTGVLVADNLDVNGGTLTVNGDLDVEATGSITNTGTITVQ